MKISNSKKQLAKIISENGGWRERAESAAQCVKGEVSFWHDTATKARGEDWCGSYLGSQDDIAFTGVRLANWHQTILSRDEYFYLYQEQGLGYALNAAAPEDELSIEQLAADYRNAKDYAGRKQQEADAAKAGAEAKLTTYIAAAGSAVGLVLSVVVPEPEPELVITDWRDLQVGDEIVCRDGTWANSFIDRTAVVVEVESGGYYGSMPVRAEVDGETDWGDAFTFIRRPAKEASDA